jgi:glycerophosphoryl diester phosphodiesterase
MLDGKHGLVVERDATEGDLNGFKAIYQITLGADGASVKKELVVDLMKVKDANKLSGDGSAGDVGLGESFAFPFAGVDGVVFLGGRKVGVLNDSNFPFGVGRHAGSKIADDSEFIVIDVGRDLLLP